MALLCDEFHSLAVALQGEVGRARDKFPGNRFLTVALMEEVGELSSAQLQRKPLSEVKREALQVMCVAARIYLEGDASLGDVTDAEALK